MSPSFTFHTVKTVHFEPGCAAKLADPIGSMLGERIMMITDPGLMKLGLPGPAMRSLQEAGAELTVFHEVEADPSLATLMKATEKARADDVTGVVGFGGGSSMDIAKLVALLAGSAESIDDAWGVGNAKGPRLPLALVPTTAGTGSEVTPISIITLDGEEKRGVSSPIILPDAAILDPELTLGLPAHTTAATGIDAMVHAIEAYTSTSPNNNAMSKQLAKEALSLLGQHITDAVRTPKSIEARGGMLLGAMLAGQAFANSPVAAVHALAYPIGGRFHVSHGLSNALILPHVMRFNAAGSKKAQRKYAELGPYAFPDLPKTDGDQAGAAAFIERLAALCEDLGLETTLREVGIGREDLPLLAADSMKQTRLLVNNPREVTQDDALSLYELAF